MGSENHFLASLGPDDRELLRPSLHLCVLERDQVLVRAGQSVANAVLPQAAIVSVISVMTDGRQVESRTVGREGAFGLLHALGSRISFEQVIVQVGGPAHRIALDALAEGARQSPSLLRAIVVHAQATLVQSAQNSACNALHGVEPRLCRWLLLTQDRLGSDVLPLTQEHLAIMLGVQRTTVTAAARQLQDRGAIAYSRGKIRVLERAQLMDGACECYEAIEDAAGRILGDA